MSRFMAKAVALTYALLSVALASDELSEDCPQSMSFLQMALESKSQKLKSSDDCPTPEAVAKPLLSMTWKGPTMKEALGNCAMLSLCVDSSQFEVQNAWAQAGAIEFVAASLQAFPENVTVVAACTMAMSPLILFNRDNGLRAGRLGALNVTLAYYGAHLDKPAVADLGGAIGAYFDYCDENRLIARELGGVQMFIQNIRNNFHGQYSDWGYEPVKQSLYALSSGTWTNADIAYQEAFPSLGVQLMNEHGNETKIAEETLQAVKAMGFASDFYRSRWSDLGIFEALTGVLLDNPTDRGAISLAGETTFGLVGPDEIIAGPPIHFRYIPFNASIQQRATEAKLLEAFLTTAMSDEELEQFDHDAFNFDLDAAYPAKANCYKALRILGKNNTANQEAMRQAGITESIRKAWQTLDLGARTEACKLVAELGEPVTPLCPLA